MKPERPLEYIAWFVASAGLLLFLMVKMGKRGSDPNRVRLDRLAEATGGRYPTPAIEIIIGLICLVLAGSTLCSAFLLCKHWAQCTFARVLIQPEEDTTRILHFTRRHWVLPDEKYTLVAHRDDDGVVKWMAHEGTNWVPMFDFDPQFP